MASARSALSGPRTRRRRRRPAAIAVAALLVALGAAASIGLWHGLRAGRHARVLAPVSYPQLLWAPPGTPPLSDAAAAALVTPRPELRPGNAAANAYVPSEAQLHAYYDAPDAQGRTRAQFSPLLGHVTGRPGLAHPTTDDLVQWAAHKWGIPEELLSAQVQLESGTRMDWLGDLAAVSPVVYAQYPSRARVPGGRYVYESMGMAQIKWVPDGTVGAGTEPLRWQSTAFDLDVLGATLRYYYDGDCGWCGAGYTAGQGWGSVGAWYSPTPWGNHGAKRYVGSVKRVLRNREWE